ncbi:MAG: VWA domain-containing protein [Spirochaetales bacterium]|nr:VWA domain-containing protein [Spirochaetales bacterium]
MECGNIGGFLVLLLIPLILYLNREEKRFKRIPVSSHLFWGKIYGTKKKQLFRERLLKNLLLILQIGTLISIAFSAAEPYIVQYVISWKHDTVLIMDTSAGMNTVSDDGHSRYYRAKKEAMKLLEKVTDENRMLVMEAGPQSRILTAFTSDRNRLREIIDSGRASDTPADISGAVSLACSLANKVRGDEIILITDCAFDDKEIPDISAYNFRIIQAADSSPTVNSGITRFAARKRKATLNDYEIMFSVYNGRSGAADFSLSLLADGVKIADQNIRLEAEEEKTFFSHAGEISAQALMLTLNTDDGLDADNHAYWILSNRKKRVALIGTRNEFLLLFCDIFPGIESTVIPVPSGTEPIPGLSGYDAVLFNQYAPRVLPAAGNYLFFEGFPGNVPFKVKGRFGYDEITRFNPDHPVTKEITASRIRVKDGLDITLKNTGTMLAGSKRRPLVVSQETGTGKRVFFTFSLFKSDLPLLPDFVVLMGNVFSWFFGDQDNGENMATGQAYALPAAAGNYRITTPDARKVDVSPDSNPPLFKQTLKAGFYKIETESGTRFFAASLLDRDESNIQPRFKGSLLKTGFDEVTHRLSHDYKLPLQSWFTLACFILLGMEWFFYWLAGRKKVKNAE